MIISVLSIAAAICTPIGAVLAAVAAVFGAYHAAAANAKLDARPPQ
jgi:hypothetical protein